MHSLCARKRPRAGSLLRRQRAAGLGEWQDVNGTISRLPRLLIRIILLSLLALLKYFERFSQRMRAIVVAAIARFKMLSMCLSNPVPTRGNEYGSSSADSNFLSWLGLAHLYISSRTEYTKTKSFVGFIFFTVWPSAPKQTLSAVWPNSACGSRRTCRKSII